MTANDAATIRTAPDGARVAVTTHPEMGALTWYGITRLTGPLFDRGFDLAPVGEHRAIPQRVMPGARQRVFRRRGFDVILYEAADRSDSCLVWAGPQHGAVTWFGGPAPRDEVLGIIMSAVSFADSPTGARVAGSSRLLRQFGTVLVGRSRESVLMVRSAAEGLPALPEWRGLVRGDAEVWRMSLDLDPDRQQAVAGTPFEWRYIIGNRSSVAEVIFPPPPRANLGAASEQDRVTKVLSSLKTSWGA